MALAFLYGAIVIVVVLAVGYFAERRRAMPVAAPTLLCQSGPMNIWDDEWGEQGEDWSGGGGRGKRLVASGPVLGASLYELDRGNFALYHAHHGSEELLIVLRGRPTLRTPDGERQLEEGEVVHFPAGPRWCAWVAQRHR